MRHPLWARREIARLDPERDARRIVHLSFEVRYGNPMFVYALFSLAFARQVAIPGIARVLWRGGRGDIVTETRKRNKDTLLFFGQFFRHWDDAQGQAAAEQLRKIHARFNIPNDLNLYTLATLACEPQRVAERLAGRNIFTLNETRAMYVFWRRIGELLGITDIPEDEFALRDWMTRYEAAHYAYSPDGAGVVAALAADVADLILPAAASPFGQSVFHALFDPHLMNTHRICPPSWPARTLTKLAARGYLCGVTQFTPDTGERDLITAFGSDYAGRFDLKQVGPKRDLARH